MILISVFSDISAIMSQSGDKDGKKSSSSKDKDTRLLSEMAKELVAPNQEALSWLTSLAVAKLRCSAKSSLWVRLP